MHDDWRAKKKLSSERSKKIETRTDEGGDAVGITGEIKLKSRERVNKRKIVEGIRRGGGGGHEGERKV